MIPMAVATVLLFGCASTDEGINDTTAIDDTTISETETMAGDTNYENDLTADPSGAYQEIFTNTTNPIEYDEMFADIENTEQYDVLALARTNPNLSIFMTLVEKADLMSDLERLEQFTLFAPTNEAFAKVPQDKMEMLLMPGNKAQLMQLLQLHVLPSGVAALELEDNNRIKMADDRYIPVSVDFNRTNIRVGNALIVKSAEASDGYIHVVDSVIIPEDDTRDEDVGY